MNTHELTIQPIQWIEGQLQLLDQRCLPQEERYLKFSDAAEVAEAIQHMVVRGAPAIGITAAYAVVLSAQMHSGGDEWRAAVNLDIERLAKSRPTAVNLVWALNRMSGVLDTGAANVVPALLAEAQRIHQEDLAANLHMSEAGANLLLPNSRVLTHCNTGTLATGGYGTALGVIRSGWEQDKITKIYADETRPWLQGSRLTAWELQRESIPVTLLCEGAAASLMQQEKIEWVIVGADRIAGNGDVANKIGTYSLAVLARHHGVKMMVVAPASTVDMGIAKGDDIPVELRGAEELLDIGEQSIGTPGVEAWNPVFDITPGDYIDYIVTETATVQNPTKDTMRAAFR